MSSIPPLGFGASGPIPSSPTTLSDALITAVEAEAPGYTADLPGSLIEDMSSTGTQILVSCDQDRVDAANNLSPSASNASVLVQQGQCLGLPPGLPTNTSVYVVISGPAGYIIQQGFTVSDGTNQYTIPSGGTIASNGQSASLYAVSTNANQTTAPGAGTVTQIISSLPSGVTLTVTNLLAGTVGTGQESVASYRTRILAGMAEQSQGMAGYVKTLLMALPGVNSRLVSVITGTGGWEVICGGGDPYQIAGAIYSGVSDISRIVGSSTTALNISATITDGTDSYTIPFINPPSQTVTMTVTWNTTLTNFTSGALVNQYGSAALINYINSIPVGQPLNELEMTYAFQEAVISVLSPVFLTTLAFTVYINGSGTATPPNAGTAIIPSPVTEGYWTAAAGSVTVTQG